MIRILMVRTFKVRTIAVHKNALEATFAPL